jgi:ParB family transcriptional regulator, chromosome partitioning protein
VSAKKGLGRGFDSLIPTELLDESFDPTAGQDDQISELRHIKLTEITPDPDQPRRYFDEESLEDLAQSVKEHGVLQPIVVTPKKGGYQIVAGERRFRAATRAGLNKIPALVRTLTNQHKLELSLIENLQRRDLNVIETATAYLKLRDQFNLTLDQIGQRVGGRAISSVSNTIRLLRLPESVKTALAENKLSEGQARPLINLEPELIEEVLPFILKEGWSARRIEQFLVQMRRSDGKKAPGKSEKKIRAIPYENETRDIAGRLEASVRVNTTEKGNGQITILFKNDEDFQRLKKILG